MGRFIEGDGRGQLTLLPTSLDDYIEEDNPVRVIDVFIDELDLGGLGFTGVVPAATGRPGYHPATLLKIYLYGYQMVCQRHIPPWVIRYNLRRDHITAELDPHSGHDVLICTMKQTGHFRKYSPYAFSLGCATLTGNDERCRGQSNHLCNQLNS